MSDIQLLQGNCLELMKDIPDHSVDMVLCDLPYGVTHNKWDTIIDFDKLWGVRKSSKTQRGNLVIWFRTIFQ